MSAAEAASTPPTETKPHRADLANVDLRLLDYVDGFDKNLMCPICHCPFVEATRLACDHTFCSFCLHAAFRNQSTDVKSCPSCRSFVDLRDSAPVPRFISHMIDDLEVLCPNHDAGCSKHLRRGDVQSHVSFYCNDTLVPCPSTNCTLSIKRRDCTAGCLHSIVECDLCEAKVMKLDLEDHAESRCPEATSQCPHCRELMPVRVFKAHEATCGKAVVPCTAASIGCNVSSKRIELPSHEAGCALVALLPFMDRLGSRMEKQDASIQSLRHRNDFLESSVADLRASLDESLQSAALAKEGSLPGAVALAADASVTPHDAPFDSAMHHLLSLHESLREDLDRLSGSVTDLDGRISMMVINENLRLKEELTHTNAVINSMRMQLQWLTNARLQSQPRFANQAPSASSAAGLGSAPGAAVGTGPAAPVRRLSDSSTKL